MKWSPHFLPGLLFICKLWCPYSPNQIMDIPGIKLNDWQNVQFLSGRWWGFTILLSIVFCIFEVFNKQNHFKTSKMTQNRIQEPQKYSTFLEAKWKRTLVRYGNNSSFPLMGLKIKPPTLSLVGQTYSLNLCLKLNFYVLHVLIFFRD